MHRTFDAEVHRSGVVFRSEAQFCCFSDNALANGHLTLKECKPGKWHLGLLAWGCQCTKW